MKKKKPDSFRKRDEIARRVKIRDKMAGKDDSFLKIYLPLNFIMTRTEAMAFAWLVRFSETVHADEHFDGWFFCHMEKRAVEMVCCPRTESRDIHLLKKGGWIETKKDRNGQRLIRICYEEVERQIAKEKAKWMDQNEGLYKRYLSLKKQSIKQGIRSSD